MTQLCQHALDSSCRSSTASNTIVCGYQRCVLLKVPAAVAPRSLPSSAPLEVASSTLVVMSCEVRYMFSPSSSPFLRSTSSVRAARMAIVSPWSSIFSMARRIWSFSLRTSTS